MVALARQRLGEQTACVWCHETKAGLRCHRKLRALFPVAHTLLLLQNFASRPQLLECPGKIMTNLLLGLRVLLRNVANFSGYGKL